MSVLSDFRRLPEEIQTLGVAVLLVSKNLEDLILLQVEKGGTDERLDELERRRAGWEAEIEATLLKADSTLKAASNAESRSRTMLRHAEKLSDPLGLEGEEEPDAISESHVPRSEEEGLLDVPLALAPTAKELALRAKFG